MQRSLTLTIGRYQVTGNYESVPLSDEAQAALVEYEPDPERRTYGIPSDELGRLELVAAIAVLSRSEVINGDELRFARKAMGLTQPELASRLDVATETVSRWETGADPLRRQTQLAVLLFLEHTASLGKPDLLVSNDVEVRAS